MALVAFLRGANVGGRRVFRPASLARDLAHLDMVNVGAAGTFVVRGKIGQAALRSVLLQRLPFETELMICTARDLIALALANPFPRRPSPQSLRRFVSVLAKRPRTLPPLPIAHPAGGDWQVKIIGVTGRFACSLWRRVGRTLVYPNEVVEKHLGVSATTRNWDTISAICRLARPHR